MMLAMPWARETIPIHFFMLNRVVISDAELVTTLMTMLLDRPRRKKATQVNLYWLLATGFITGGCLSRSSGWTATTLLCFLRDITTIQNDDEPRNVQTD